VICWFFVAWWLEVQMSFLYLIHLCFDLLNDFLLFVLLLFQQFQQVLVDHVGTPVVMKEKLHTTGDGTAMQITPKCSAFLQKFQLLVSVLHQTSLT